MKYLLLEVIGTRPYRNHHVGDHFITKVDEALERGIARGNVRVITEVQRRLGEFGFPKDWPRSAADAQLTSKGGKQ